jgi:hypothetical protein
VTLTNPPEDPTRAVLRKPDASASLLSGASAGRRILLSIAIVLVCLSACTEPSTTSQSTTAPAQSPAPPEDSPSAEPSGSRLVESLRSGGHVIYFRHAATNPVPDDADPVDLRNCGTQRNLSVKGR